jgi:hypothetical protein
MSDDLALSSLLAIVLGSAWASGINVYAVLLVLGLCDEFNYLILPAGLDLLNNPIVLIALGFMYCVEFVADKIPGVDSGWDLLHTFIRIPIAALLAGAFFEESYPQWEFTAQWLGALLALSSHLTKTSSRLLINTSPEPFSNWGASLGEDVMVFAALWLALSHPYVFFAALIAFIALVIWLLPKILRALLSIIAKIASWLRGGNSQVT